MGNKLAKINGFIVLGLVIISLTVFGCSQQSAPPPAAPPPPAPSAAVTPQPSAATQAGTAQPAPAGTPAADPNQLQIGMASTQVQQIMGVPAQTKQKGAMTEWKYYTPQGKVEVQIQNDKVIGVDRH
jgi:hypothetical protein